MKSTDFSENSIIGKSESRNSEETITELQKMPKCMMLREDKFLGLEATDILGLPRTFLEFEIFTREKFRLPLPRQQLR